MNPSPKIPTYAQAILGIIFHFAVLALIVLNYETPSLNADPKILKGLITGTHQGIDVPGSDIAPLKNILPKKGRLAFLMGAPFGTDSDQTRRYTQYQNFLAPLLLNPRGGETAGIIFTSSDEIMNQRLNEEGYVLLHKITEGKAVIRKQP